MALNYAAILGLHVCVMRSETESLTSSSLAALRAAVVTTHGLGSNGQK